MRPPPPGLTLATPEWLEMATEAGHDSTTPDGWMWLSDAVAIGAVRYGGASARAARRLVKAMEAGTVPWTCKDVEQTLPAPSVWPFPEDFCTDKERPPQPEPGKPGDSRFWRRNYPLPFPNDGLVCLDLCVEHNAAHNRYVGCTVWGIMVSRVAVEGLFGAVVDEQQSSAPEGYQAERLLAFLRRRYPPAGKTPRSKHYKELIGEFVKDPEVIEEHKRTGRRPPARGVMYVCRKYLGYCED